MLFLISEYEVGLLIIRIAILKGLFKETPIFCCIFNRSANIGRYLIYPLCRNDRKEDFGITQGATKDIGQVEKNAAFANFDL